jgi:hypothetical protein
LSHFLKSTLVFFALGASSVFATPSSGDQPQNTHSRHCSRAAHACAEASFPENKERLLKHLHARQEALADAMKCIEAAQSAEALGACRPSRGQAGLKREIRTFNKGILDREATGLPDGTPN